MSKRMVLMAGRICFGLLALTAVGAQLVVHIQHEYSVVNFFSYFTNLSNIFAALMLLAGALILLREREPSGSVPYDLVRATSVAAMAIVGIVYGVLLRNEDLGSLMPWVNIVVHYVMPVAVVLDWLILPPRSQLGERHIGYVLIYPLAYLVYTLIRGAATGWYPYPFLNPARAGGYGGVALYCLGIFAAFLVVGWLVVRLGGVRKIAMSLQPA
jgi:hypothetical protein